MVRRRNATRAALIADFLRFASFVFFGASAIERDTTSFFSHRQARTPTLASLHFAANRLKYAKNKFVSKVTQNMELPPQNNARIGVRASPADAMIIP
jgi:hypothetical protein